MDKKQALLALRKDLMRKYEFMRCGNLEEFKQRLQWLSEGMLQNHILGQVHYKPRQDEIDLYNEYREARARIQEGK